MERNDTVLEIRKELRSIVQSIRQLSNHVENVALAIEKLSLDTSSKKDVQKRSPVRKKVLFKDGVVETIKRVPATKIVHDIILKSGSGIDIKTLMDQTGYDQRKIYNVTFLLKQQGKIKRIGHGVYGKS